MEWYGSYRYQLMNDEAFLVARITSPYATAAVAVPGSPPAAPTDPKSCRRPKRFLSQTSWVSLPLLPTRRVASNSSEPSTASSAVESSASEGNGQDQLNPEPITRAVSTILESPAEAEDADRPAVRV